MGHLRKLTILVACLSVALAGTQKATVLADEPQRETISQDGKLYTNDVFDLSISKPEDWYAQSTEELFKTQQLGAGIVSGSDRNLQALMKESLKTSFPLFGFYQYLPGSPTPTNPNISGVAENVSLYPGIKKGCDYLYSAKQLIAQSQLQLKFGDECQTANINGSEFGYYDASITFGDRQIKQRYYACIQNTHAISVIQTYFSPEEEELVNGIIDTLEVKCN